MNDLQSLALRCREPRLERWAAVRLVLLGFVLWGVAGCAPQTSKPGRIVHHRTLERSAGATVVVIRAPGTQPAVSVQVIPPGPDSATVIENEEYLIEQPENPAGEASLERGKSRAVIPNSYPPPAAPAAPTPTARALGGLVWLGGLLLVLGVLGTALRLAAGPLSLFFPALAFLKAVPLGLSVGVALSGVLLIAVATVLAASPWWVLLICVLAVVGISLMVAFWDNVKKLFAGTT